jgi:hypothetical protein
MDSIAFIPNQIICIDRSPDLLLLAEVIQMVPERERCWARPLALAQVEEYQLKLLHDLREAPQLILPASFFREALDTEVLPLMTELFQWNQPQALAKETAQGENLSSQALHNFIRGLSIET